MSSIPIKNRLKLIIPQPPKGGKILKTCTRCRQHKTKCDAIDTNPLPCSHCLKKNLDCTLDYITKTGGRTKSLDILEKLSYEVTDLKEVLNNIINRRNELINSLIKSGKEIQHTSKNNKSLPSPPKLIESSPNEDDDETKTLTPPVAEIQSCLSTPVTSPETTPLDINYELPHNDTKFIIQCNKQYDPVILTHKQAALFFTNYEEHFNHYLPIFPDEFFTSLSLNEFYKENELLFWSIILTSLLNKKELYKEYQNLSEHIKYLVVKKCWLNTPRSVYVISSLLILTTWPLPNYKNNIEDNLSVKFISTMKSLSYQFGLHKLDFIEEFSHKTKMNISQEINLNNLIRERIYKFVNIISNYWMINLGISNNNYNGFTQDYIINKSANIEFYQMDDLNQSDQYINAMLKISMIQSKLNENMNNLINNNNESILLLPNQVNTSTLINFNMFEIIINDLQKTLSEFENSRHANLIKISIYYSKLQLFIYSMSKSDISLIEYKNYLHKLLNVCFDIIRLVESMKNTGCQTLPIFYKFPIELTVLIMLRVFKSPLLETVNDYQLIKANFQKIYGFLIDDTNWLFLNLKISKIIQKFNNLDNMFLLKLQKGSFFLINRMKNYLVGSLNFELIWSIYENQKNRYHDRQLDLSIYNPDIINYLELNESIL
ncbi:SEF1 Transcriptional regulatory protein SEF1 [Candida maltosa Xu316]|uniref:Zinc cluster transcription factor, putative n=1 Tax=Candida maltosa (strain Xu316) TaxID=1245528 RepID=M3IJ51_CANMX|nr:Zinc cluster transcription factor, putative [Candida maltosa Xu316]